LRWLNFLRERAESSPTCRWSIYTLLYMFFGGFLDWAGSNKRFLRRGCYFGQLVYINFCNFSLFYRPHTFSHRFPPFCVILFPCLSAKLATCVCVRLLFFASAYCNWLPWYLSRHDFFFPDVGDGFCPVLFVPSDTYSSRVP